MIERRCEDRILTLTLDRPAKLNALTPELVEALDRELARSGADPEVRVVILAGSGRAFCAGADVELALGLSAARAARFLDALAALLSRIATMPQPLVAAVQGHAVGGGAELALEADLRVFADDARLVFPDAAVGSTPTTLQPLVRLAGQGLAMEMALLGRELGAAEALRVGLASAVVPPAALGTTARQLAMQLRDRAGPRQLRAAKEAVRLASERSRAADLRANAAAMLTLHDSPEARAYVRAFARR